jgi:His/Glu/Gln/Arg/opine family amino acid ABC transporter permease subunit
MFDGLARSLALLSNYIAGFAVTTILVVELALASILVSWACGLAASLAQESRSQALDRLARFYIWFVRGTPTLIQIFIVYFGLPQFGLRLSPYVAGVLALGVNSGAFVAEILRSGLNAVPKHQRESARALGMRWLPEMWLVVLPQVLRVTLPSAHQRGDHAAQEHFAPVRHHGDGADPVLANGNRPHLPPVRVLHRGGADLPRPHHRARGGSQRLGAAFASRARHPAATP